MRIQIDPERVNRTFAAFTSNSSLQESAQLFARGRPVLEMIQAFASNENVLRAFAAFESIYPGGNLERSILERVILRVSQLHECQFCANSHVDIMRAIDISSDLADENLPERDRLALLYAEAINNDSNSVPDSLFAKLRQSFADPEIVELTFLIGFITMLNRFNNALQIRYRGELQSVTVS